MLNYLSGEIFRIKKLKIFKFLIIAGILVPAILAYIFSHSNIPAQQVEEDAFYYLIRGILPIASVIVSSFVLLSIKKPSSIYPLYLSHGTTRGQFIFNDYCLFQLLTVVLGFFMLVTTIVSNYVMCKITGLDFTFGLNTFFQVFLHTLFLQLNFNNWIFPIFYISESKLGLIVLLSLVPIVFPLIYIFGDRIFDIKRITYVDYYAKTLDYIYFNLDTYKINPIIYVYFIILAIISILISKEIIKKKEY